jgi:hypothetical protein
MAINPVAPGSSSQAILPQPQADRTKQAELAKQAEQAKQAELAEQAKPTEAPKAKPTVNTQGQTTGSVVNTVA